MKKLVITVAVAMMLSTACAVAPNEASNNTPAAAEQLCSVHPELARLARKMLSDIAEVDELSAYMQGYLEARGGDVRTLYMADQCADSVCVAAILVLQECDLWADTIGESGEYDDWTETMQNHE